jgi:hypothetical protein
LQAKSRALFFGSTEHGRLESSRSSQDWNEANATQSRCEVLRWGVWVAQGVKSRVVQDVKIGSVDPDCKANRSWVWPVAPSSWSFSWDLSAVGSDLAWVPDCHRPCWIDCPTCSVKRLLDCQQMGRSSFYGWELGRSTSKSPQRHNPWVVNVTKSFLAPGPNCGSWQLRKHKPLSKVCLGTPPPPNTNTWKEIGYTWSYFYQVSVGQNHDSNLLKTQTLHIRMWFMSVVTDWGMPWPSGTPSSNQSPSHDRACVNYDQWRRTKIIWDGSGRNLKKLYEDKNSPETLMLYIIVIQPLSTIEIDTCFI